MTTDKPRYLNTKQAAEHLSLSPCTLNRMRLKGGGPPYAKAGRKVLYDRKDLDDWIEGMKRRFTGEALG